jgi:glycerophosphoryl diester phosphodiesterase
VTYGWLAARPIAHRGLHDRARGVIENSIDAVEAAIESGCSIECDVQLSRDGEAFVFHDHSLKRLTGVHGDIIEWSSAQIAFLALIGAAGNPSIAPLAGLLARVTQRTPVIVEIKSRFDGDMRLADRAAQIAESYEGAIALKSFDPAIIAHLRRRGLRRNVPLGIVAEARFDHPDWKFLDARMKESMACLLHWRDTQPDFLSFCVDDLPHAGAHLARTGLTLPVMTWTVRTAAQWDIAKRYADQAIFEGQPP